LELLELELPQPPLCEHGSLEQLIAPINMTKNAAAITLFI